MKKQKKKRNLLIWIILLIAIIVAIGVLGSKTQLISSITGSTSGNEAGTSTTHYYHFDLRIDGSYELSDGTTGTATVDEIVAVNQTTSETIALSMSSSMTKDENSSGDVYEYKSTVGHGQGQDLGLYSTDTVQIDLIFTYASKTQEITLEYELDDSNNLCGGTKGTETYGYDIEISLQDYIDEAIEQQIETYTYTINYYYNGVQDTNETITGESAAGLTINYTEKDKGMYDLDETATTATSMVISSEYENVLNIFYVSDVCQVIAYYYLYDTTTEEYTTISLAGLETYTGYEGTAYQTVQKSIDGYTFYEVVGTTSGTMTEETIIVKYYYTIDEVSVSNDITKTSDITVLTDEDGTITYTINYEVSISNYSGTADITIVDTLPYEIDEENSSLNGGTYSSTNKTITWTESIEVDSSYSDTITKTISVSYINVDPSENIENTVTGTTKIYYPDTYEADPGGVRETVTDTDTDEIEQEYTISKIVKKTWNDTTTTHRPSSVTVTLYANNDIAYDYNGEEVETAELTDNNSWSYTFENLPKYDSSGNEIDYTVEESETTSGDLEYYYEASYTYGSEYIEIVNNYKTQDVELDADLSKTATSEITSSTDEVTYTINYTATISEYTGDATLTVVDTLPYAIDEELSDLAEGTYNSNDNTITWEVSIEGITEGEDYVVDFSKTITVVYGENLDATASSMINNVEATIYLIDDGSTNTVEDSATTTINIPATLIVKYLEKDTLKVLADEVTITKTPGYEYKTEAETIDGYTFVETNGVATTGTLSEGTTTVIYYYEKTEAEVVVNYVDYDTGETLTDSVTISGYVNDDYTTEEKKFSGYTFVEVVGDTTGTMTEDKIYVTYYYTKTSASVIVYYYLYDNGYTENILADTEVISGYVGKDYSTVQKDIDNYSYYTVVGDTTGSMTEDIIYVYYYYEKIPATLTVNYYLYDNGYTETKLADSITGDTYLGESYETEQKTISGYTYAGTTGDETSGIIESTETVVNYYYSANDAVVVVTYVDTDGNTLATSETIEGKVNEGYETEEKDITGYTLTETPENATGTMTEGTTYVEYVYQKNTGTVIVYHYLYDEEVSEDGHTTTELADPETKTGYYGDDYTTSASSDVLGTYELVETSSNTVGTFTDETIYVYYYYKLSKSAVHVTYVDIDTGEEIADDETISGYIGDSYETTEKTIEYYTLESTSGNTSGSYVEDTTEVIYYYRKATFNMSIEKKVTSITVDGETTTKDGVVGRIEVGRNDTSDTTISITYRITVTNADDIDGTATVVDYIPDYFKVSSNNPNYWTTLDDGNIQTEVSLSAGESIELTVVLDWINGTDNFGVITNVASITGTTNTPNYSETTTDDNTSSVPITLSIRTGLDVAIDVAPKVMVVLIALAAVLTGIKAYKKRR